MRVHSSIVILAAVSTIGFSQTSASADHEAIQVTFASLLREMIDRDALASWPAPEYVCRQASSYDRDSTDPKDPDTWFANWDRSQFLRIEEGDENRGPEYVLMDAAGPGAVVRFWATWHGPGGGEFSNGALKVYLDGHDEAVIEGPIRDVLSGGALVGPPLSDFNSKTCPEPNRAHNLYLPIPYARHCKITYQTKAPIDPGARRGEALYYQIDYRTYASGTRVETFTIEDLGAQRSLLETTRQVLEKGPADSKAKAVVDLAGVLAPGRTKEALLEGPAAIRELTFRLDAEDGIQALRSTVIEIAFDGERTVWCPLGDFFGSGHGIHPFATFFTSARADGTLRSRWVMPFARSARIRIRNLGQQVVHLTRAEGRASPWDWNDRSMHFHATWRQYSRYTTKTSDMSGRGGPRDVNFIRIQGRGVYVGDTLTVFDPVPAWWGEGDEKIFVDGESFPSHFGTGTEDYYGYAWCRGETFSTPFGAQPIGEGNLGEGPTVNSRYRLLDGIPFKKSLRFDMELWSWANTTINYAPTTFWYARPGATCNVDPLPDIAREPVAREPEDLIEVHRVKGAIEGETMKIARRSGGTTEIQNIPQFGWSNNRQLWWRDATIGDELELRFDVEAAGRHAVTACLTLAPDYAVVQLAIDGKPVGDPLDLYHPSVKTGLFPLGRHRLGAGEHRLSVRITGINEKAIKRHMFGLDYLLLEGP